MNLAVDLHDTLTYHPGLVCLVKHWPYQVYIVTGTPESQRQQTLDIISGLGLYQNDYTKLVMGFEYQKSEMTKQHFNRMCKHKMKVLTELDVNIYIDDNPYYVQAAKDMGILVLQPILSVDYIRQKVAAGDLFFSSHLQEHQFDFLTKDDK